MPSNYEKLSRPSGDTTTLTIPDKAASTTLTVNETPRLSTTSTPQTDKLNPFDTDIEAMVTNTRTSESNIHKTNSPARKTDCQVWPGKDHWKKQAKAAKAKNRCTCMAHLSQRNRWIVKGMIILLVVGIAVGVGFGVSKPLNAPIWGDKHGDKK
ncbi:uncharacterized protein FIESC28_02003 [Fusarium coffeatum]|uniref:Uncharacterized protein n=2 Tax=Fusarium incarnatum-equiseti species complex TaxID=450425 RepID=A0A395M595_9HYPO|nr:uncharacterized protein FIESC28_02003 [Fusarium coffeatum]XP_045979820.1 uncharacterized protein B0J16DRAFT_168297 [Fusarium flagelliforme]KAH7179242.1 hypothetical protein B0J16DRAFT_168297 [Fusarium flagelliforme]RBR25095.1 hypothetical protein FIESC28_02003 [Fusarium coffeatum]RFN42880.1 hypothetical protein FIE12Z_12697 [Fusarium flagelliforme]